MISAKRMLKPHASEITVGAIASVRGAVGSMGWIVLDPSPQIELIDADIYVSGRKVPSADSIPQGVSNIEIRVPDKADAPSTHNPMLGNADVYDSAEEGAIRRKAKRKAKRRKRLSAKPEKKSLHREAARLEAEEREANVALRAKQKAKVMVQREKRRAKALRRAKAAAQPLATNS